MSVVLDLPQDLQDAYTFFAKEQDISKEKLMQKALEAYLEDLDIALHERRIQNYKNDIELIKQGKMRLLSADEVFGKIKKNIDEA